MDQPHRQAARPSSRRSSSTCSAPPLDDEWARWIEFERRGSRRTSTRSAYPVTPFKPLSERALGSVSRGFFDPKRGSSTPPSTTPASSPTSRRSTCDSWEKRRSPTSTPALYYVTSLAFDPGTRTIFYTTDNCSHWRDFNARRPRHRARPRCCSRTSAHRRPRLQPRRQVALGRAARQRHLDAGPDRPPYDLLELTEIMALPTGTTSSTSTSPRTGRP